MDIPVLSQVIAVLNRIGKNTDAAGTNTVFAYLARGVVKSLQRGSFTNSGPITISSVNMSKALLVWNYDVMEEATGSSAGSSSAAVSAYLSSATQVTVTGAIPSGYTGYWQLIEFY